MMQTPSSSATDTLATDTMANFNPVSFTRNAFNRHRTTSRWSAVGDVYQALFGAAIILTYAGSLFYGIQQDLVADSGWFLTRPLVSDHFSRVPAPLAMYLLLAVATAFGLLVACRTGPVAASRAQGFWWLSLPVDRRKLVVGPVLKKMIWTGCVAGLLMVPVAALSNPAHGLGSVVLASLTAVFLGAVILAAATAMQLAGLQRIVERCIGVLSGIVLLLLLLPVVVPQTDGLFGTVSAVVPLLPSSWPLLVAQGSSWPLMAMIALALVGSAAVYPKLGLLRRAELVSAGGVTGHASSALYFGDFRELGQALRTSSGAKRRFRISTRVPNSPAGVLVFADLTAFLRKPQTVGTLLGLALFPGAIALVDGVGSAIIVVVVLFFTGWRVAVVASSIAQHYADQPGLDRLLPLNASAQRRLHAVVPLLAGTAWGAAAFGVLALLGATGEGVTALGLIGMGMLSGAGLAGAAMRMAYRPEPDWTGVDGTMLTVLQTNGTIDSYTRGPDFVFLAMLPTLLALLTGALAPWMLVLQIATSLLCLWLGTRRH